MRIVRRLAILTGTTVVVCAVMWATVETVAHDPIRQRRQSSWARPDPSQAVARVGSQLAIIALVALGGRKVLRLRL